ncbi:hypothetical protein C7974DRAFT_345921 [Boeremia exigua]|uniref:uncharacterized protein n=1 Tax=Boeremia exigua TaxID=749465 RepID=UPI001E8D96E6|nr:uncharacterized protein C7974DRAFT_345921 [Boeremia exigua]KAH6612399.1 hypothetical protein C7974DRAFT_345921 [Boeremia exigua]
MSSYKPLRRSHKKSRHGCNECKRRHIKCDETQPACTKCLNESRVCIYQSPFRRVACRSPSTTSDTVTEPSDTAALSATPSDGLVSQVPTPSLSTASAFYPTPSGTAEYGSSDAPLNMRHIELFSHFVFETVPSLDETNSIDREHARFLMPVALSEPYVVHQLLALSAMHMGHTHAGESKRHREEAKTLQTQAVCLFNDSHLEVTMETCAPMLIFSSFLGLHALAEVTAALEAGTSGILDRFVTYINLHRGVRAITAQSWQFLKHSSISSILSRAERSLNDASSSKHEQAVIVSDHLHALLENSDMSSTPASACREAVSQLILVYQTEPVPGELPTHGQPSGLIWAWPVLLSGGFADLLLMRRPEALVILCHYAVLLHRRRHMWLVGNVGQILIKEISTFLGSFWKEWLEWPNEMMVQSLIDT